MLSLLQDCFFSASTTLCVGVFLGENLQTIGEHTEFPRVFHITKIHSNAWDVCGMPADVCGEVHI